MKLVICEGQDDMAVLLGICEFFQLQGLTIEHCGGRGNLERYIVSLQIRPEFTRLEVESVAILIDAEESKEAAWQKLRNAVKLGFDLLLPAPGIFVAEQPRIAGFIVSGEKDAGMIEDVCLASVSQQPGYICLQDYFRCLAEKTERKTYHSKAKFRAWMASQSEYEFHVGKAASHGFLPWGSAAFAPIREFLQSL